MKNIIKVKLKRKSLGVVGLLVALIAGVVGLGASPVAASYGQVSNTYTSCSAAQWGGGQTRVCTDFNPSSFATTGALIYVLADVGGNHDLILARSRLSVGQFAVQTPYYVDGVDRHSVDANTIQFTGISYNAVFQPYWNTGQQICNSPCLGGTSSVLLYDASWTYAYTGAQTSANVMAIISSAVANGGSMYFAK